MPQALLFSLKGALARGNKDAAATFTERLRALGEAALPAVRKEHDETQDAEWRAALDMIIAGK
ncbi:MAG: hypothetical protein HYZ53_28275 [Planctomycetes bacterium]|nr:hypothetical protein [Planctomycetota bacterium]